MSTRLSNMDMDQAAVFLAGSILYCIGLLIILCGVVIANNILYKYWKSFGWKLFPSWFNEPIPRFATNDEIEKISPRLDPIDPVSGEPMKEINNKEKTK